MKPKRVRPIALTAICVILISLPAVSFAKSFDGNGTWRILDNARTQYENGNFGEALLACEKARESHETAIKSAIAELERALSPSDVKKIGDDIDQLYAKLGKRDETAALEILDSVFLNHPASYFGNSMPRLLDWLRKMVVYPEADFLTGMIYETEGETAVAFTFYENAWKNRDVFDVLDDRFTLAYRMADLAKTTGNSGAQEKYLLLVLTGDELFGIPGNESPTLAAMMHTLEIEATTVKFFSLYRYSRRTSLKACRDLASLYLENGRSDRAYPAAVLSACIAVTLLSDAVSGRDYSYEYENLSDLMRRAGKNREITQWARDTGIWQSFHVLARALDAKGQKEQARSLWNELALNCPDGTAARLARDELALR